MTTLYDTSMIDGPSAQSPDPATVIDSYVGSPLYAVLPDHEAAVLAVLALGLWYALWGRRSGGRWMVAYRSLSPIHRLLSWLLAISAVVHLALALSHGPSGYSLGYGLGAIGLIWVGRRLLAGGRWRRASAVILTTMLVGYTLSLLGGEPPDQVGIGTKLVELSALAIVLAPRTDSRVRRVIVNVGIVAMSIFVALGGWVGAFSSGGDGHHLGAAPHPGVLLPPGEDRTPTPAEIRATDDLYAATAAAIAKYRDVEVAAADGYDVSGLAGQDFHATNPAYEHDDHHLDPERPETLVYAVGASGEPLLLGAMFQMDDIGQVGPAVGGPLTVWHAHDRICFTVPFALAGLTSPYGLCPLGAVTLPITQEMMHIWTLPGVEDPFGDLDEIWLADVLASS